MPARLLWELLINMRIDQKTTQTSEPKGAFQFGDEHPSKYGLVYRGWIGSSEQWTTNAKLFKHRASIAASAAAWDAANPARRAHRKARSKARKRGQAPLLTPAERDSCVMVYELMQKLNREAGAIEWNVDHILALSNGGLHVPGNLQVCPAEWNRSKGDKHSERWNGDLPK